MDKSGIIRIASALFLSAWVGGAAAAEYQIDGAHSDVTFRVKHMGISTVTGKFDKFTGSFDVDPKNVKATKGNAVIEVASVNTGNGKRDDDLRSDNFFDAAKFPEIKFVSKEVKDVNEADSTCTLIGDLTMKGITKEIALKVKGGGIMKDDWGNERAAFTATGKLNRFDYGLKWNKAIESGGFVVGENVELVLDFEGVRKLEGGKAPAGAASKAAAPGKAQEKTESKANADKVEKKK